MAMERTEQAVRSDEDEWTNSEGEQPEMQVGFVEVVEDENFLHEDSKRSKKDGPAWKIDEDTTPTQEIKKEEKKGTYAAKLKASHKAPPKTELFPTLSDAAQQVEKKSEKTVQKSEKPESKETANIYTALEDEGAKEEEETQTKQVASVKKEKKSKKKWAKHDATISLAITAGQKEGNVFDKDKIVPVSVENLSEGRSRETMTGGFRRNNEIINSDIGRDRKPFGFKRDEKREDRKAPDSAFGPIRRNDGPVKSPDPKPSAFGPKRETQTPAQSGLVRNPIQEKPKDAIFGAGPKKFLNSKKADSKPEGEKKEEAKVEVKRDES